MLKIKENINLEELKKFGFYEEINIFSGKSMFLKIHKSNPTKKYFIQTIVDWERGIETIKLWYNTISVDCYTSTKYNTSAKKMKSISSKKYNKDIIQAGLVKEVAD